MTASLVAQQQRSSRGRRRWLLSCCLAVFVGAACLSVAGANESSHTYKDAEPVILWVNKVGPYNNPQVRVWVWRWPWHTTPAARGHLRGVHLLLHSSSCPVCCLCSMRAAQLLVEHTCSCCDAAAAVVVRPSHRSAWLTLNNRFHPSRMCNRGTHTRRRTTTITCPSASTSRARRMSTRGAGWARCCRATSSSTASWT